MTLVGARRCGTRSWRYPVDSIVRWLFRVGQKRPRVEIRAYSVMSYRRLEEQIDPSDWRRRRSKPHCVHLSGDALLANREVRADISAFWRRETLAHRAGCARL